MKQPFGSAPLMDFLSCQGPKAFHLKRVFQKSIYHVGGSSGSLLGRDDYVNLSGNLILILSRNFNAAVTELGFKLERVHQDISLSKRLYFHTACMSMVSARISLES